MKAIYKSNLRMSRILKRPEKQIKIELCHAQPRFALSWQKFISLANGNTSRSVVSLSLSRKVCIAVPNGLSSNRMTNRSGLLNCHSLSSWRTRGSGVSAASKPSSRWRMNPSIVSGPSIKEIMEHEIFLQLFLLIFRNNKQER